MVLLFGERSEPILTTLLTSSTWPPYFRSSRAYVREILYLSVTDKTHQVIGRYADISSARHQDFGAGEYNPMRQTWVEVNLACLFLLLECLLEIQDLITLYGRYTEYCWGSEGVSLETPYQPYDPHNPTNALLQSPPRLRLPHRQTIAQPPQ